MMRMIIAPHDFGPRSITLEFLSAGRYMSYSYEISLFRPVVSYLLNAIISVSCKDVTFG
jgi:hypothetical protein